MKSMNVNQIKLVDSAVQVFRILTDIQPNCYASYRHTLFYCTLRYCALQTLCFFTSCRFVATLRWAGLLAPFFQHHLLTLCLHIIFLQTSQNFKLFHSYICHGYLWSVVFDDTIIIVWGHHELCPYKRVNFIENVGCVLNAPLTSHSPPPPLFGPLYSLKHNNIKIRPINTI